MPDHAFRPQPSPPPKARPPVLPPLSKYYYGPAQGWASTEVSPSHNGSSWNVNGIPEQTINSTPRQSPPVPPYSPASWARSYPSQSEPIQGWQRHAPPRGGLPEDQFIDSYALVHGGRNSIVNPTWDSNSPRASMDLSWGGSHRPIYGQSPEPPSKPPPPPRTASSHFQDQMQLPTASKRPAHNSAQSAYSSKAPSSRISATTMDVPLFLQPFDAPPPLPHRPGRTSPIPDRQESVPSPIQSQRLPPPPPKIPLDQQDEPSGTISSPDRPRYDPQNSFDDSQQILNRSTLQRRPTYDPQDSHKPAGLPAARQNKAQFPVIPSPRFSRFDAASALPILPVTSDPAVLPPPSTASQHQPQKREGPKQNDLHGQQSSATTGHPADKDRAGLRNGTREGQAGYTPSPEPHHAPLAGRDGSITTTDASSNHAGVSTPESQHTSNTSYRETDIQAEQNTPEPPGDDSFYWHSGRSSSDAEEQHSQSGSTTATPGHSSIDRASTVAAASSIAREEQQSPRQSQQPVLPTRSTSLSPSATLVPYGASALGLGGPSDWEYFGDYEAEEIDDEELYTRPKPAELPSDITEPHPSASDQATEESEIAHESHEPSPVIGEASVIEVKASKSGGQNHEATTAPAVDPTGAKNETSLAHQATRLNNSWSTDVEQRPQSYDQRPDLDDVIRAWSEAPFVGIRPRRDTNSPTTSKYRDSSDPLAEASLASTPQERMLGIDLILKDAPEMPKLPDAIDPQSPAFDRMRFEGRRASEHSSPRSADPHQTSPRSASRHSHTFWPEARPTSGEKAASRRGSHPPDLSPGMGAQQEYIAQVNPTQLPQKDLSDTRNENDQSSASDDLVKQEVAVLSPEIVAPASETMPPSDGAASDAPPEETPSTTEQADRINSQSSASQKQEPQLHSSLHEVSLGQQENANSQKDDEAPLSSGIAISLHEAKEEHAPVDETIEATSEAVKNGVYPDDQIPPLHQQSLDAVSSLEADRAALSMQSQSEPGPIKPVDGSESANFSNTSEEENEDMRSADDGKTPDASSVGTHIAGSTDEKVAQVQASTQPEMHRSEDTRIDPTAGPSSQTEKILDPYSDLDPWGKASLNRFAAMLREEARAESNRDKLNIFNVFASRESRLRVVLYGTDDELILPSKSPEQKPAEQKAEDPQKPKKGGFVRQAVERANTINLQRSLKALPALPKNRESVVIPAKKLSPLVTKDIADAGKASENLPAQLEGYPQAAVSGSPTDDIQYSPGGRPIMSLPPRSNASVQESSTVNDVADQSSPNTENRGPATQVITDDPLPRPRPPPLPKDDQSEVNNYLINRRSIYRPFATQTLETLENGSNFDREPDIKIGSAPGLTLAVPNSKFNPLVQARTLAGATDIVSQDVAKPVIPHQPDLRRFVQADFDPLVAILPEGEAVVCESSKIQDLKDVIEAIPDDFSFINAAVVAWDTKARKQRAENDGQRHERQVESEKRIDALFDDHEIGYGDISELEAEFKRSEAAHKASEDRAEYHRFVEDVFNLVWTRLHYELDQLVPHYERYSTIMDKTLTGRDMFTNSDDALALAPTMTHFLALHHKVEIRHQKAFEAVLERDRRLKNTEISPWYTLSNITKVKQLEKQFEDAEKKAIIEYCEKRDARVNHLMDVLDQNTARGVGSNQDYMEAIMKAVRRIASGRAYASMPGDDQARAGLEEVQKARAVTTVLATSSEQIVQTFHVADMLLNSADYEVSVAKAKVAKVDMATLAKLKEERAKEDQKLMRALEHRLALIREDSRRTNDEIVKLMLFLGVHNGRATGAAPMARGTHTLGGTTEAEEPDPGVLSPTHGNDPAHEARMKKALEEAKRRNAVRESAVAGAG